MKIDAEFDLLDGGGAEFSQTFTDGRFFDDDVLPLTVPVPGQRPAKRAKITVDVDTQSRMTEFERIVVDRLPGDPYIKTNDDPLLSVPSSRIDGIPAFVILTDTFRYDFMDTFASTIDSLGADAVVSHEPRTQGTWTRPSHGVMLTGPYLGRNDLYGYMPDRGAISTQVETLAEMASEHGYKCSAFTASPQLLPKDGFTRGFHRYRQAPMEWKTRKNDAATVVDQTIEWTDRDRLGEHGRRFYFLHLLDSHLPYLPPLPISNPDLNLAVIDEFDTLEKQLKTYLEILDSECRELTTRQLNVLLSFYR